MTKFKAFIFDFDGVFTNGKISFDEKGNSYKSYNMKDGMGLKLLRDKKIPYFLISGDYSTITEHIAKRLKFKEYHLGISKKKSILLEIIERYELLPKEVCYMGDDINDIECFQLVGYGACPANAVKAVKKKANSVSLNGGEGCVRQLIDLMISSGMI